MRNRRSVAAHAAALIADSWDEQGEWTEWTPDCALSFKTPGGYVGQAVDMSGLSGGAL